MNDKVPWKDGIYGFKSNTIWLFVIKGESLTKKNTACIDYDVKTTTSAGSIKHGNFGATTPKIHTQTGKFEYDTEMVFWGGQMTVHAVLNDDKKSFTMIEIMNTELDELRLLSNEEIQQIKESGDPVGMS